MDERNREVGSYISGQYDAVAKKIVDFLHRISLPKSRDLSVLFWVNLHLFVVYLL